MSHCILGYTLSQTRTVWGKVGSNVFTHVPLSREISSGAGGSLSGEGLTVQGGGLSLGGFLLKRPPQ